MAIVVYFFIAAFLTVVQLTLLLAKAIGLFGWAWPWALVLIPSFVGLGLAAWVFFCCIMCLAFSKDLRRKIK